MLKYSTRVFITFVFVCLSFETSGRVASSLPQQQCPVQSREHVHKRYSSTRAVQGETLFICARFIFNFESYLSSVYKTHKVIDNYYTVCVDQNDAEKGDDLILSLHPISVSTDCEAVLLDGVPDYFAVQVFTHYPLKVKNRTVAQVCKESSCILSLYFFAPNHVSKILLLLLLLLFMVVYMWTFWIICLREDNFFIIIFMPSTVIAFFIFFF